MSNTTITLEEASTAGMKVLIKATTTQAAFAKEFLTREGISSDCGGAGMNRVLLTTEAERSAWIKERKNWDRDFDTDIKYYGLPVTVWWLDTESNGYPTVSYDVVQGDVFGALRALPEVVEALKQAQDTLAWAQHFSNHADKRAFPDTLAITESALKKASQIKIPQ